MKARCTICGYLHETVEAPSRCPSCGANQSLFESVEEDYQNPFLFYGTRVEYQDEVSINPFFGDFEKLIGFVYNLPPEKRTPLHKHPTTDAFFYVIKGNIHFKVGEKEMITHPGDMVQVKMDTPHTFKNIGEDPAVILSIKAPKPVDLEVME